MTKKKTTKKKPQYTLCHHNMGETLYVTDINDLIYKLFHGHFFFYDKERDFVSLLKDDKIIMTFTYEKDGKLTWIIE